MVGEKMGLKQDQLEAFAAIVGQERLCHSSEELACYSYDGSKQEFPPAAVLFPDSTEQVSAIMKLAVKEKIPVVPRGAGSGMTGGALAVQGGIVLAMARMNRILSIDPQNQVAVVEPGVITGDLQRSVAQYGLYYPPDPASKDFCTIGGNVAECAGGPSAIKYGVTRDYVRGLEVVLADGRIIKTGVQTAKGVVGYDLTRLFVGSEGTLGIMTRFILRLVAKPETKQTFLALTRDMATAGELVSEILRSFLPCTLEYMDRTAISVVADKLPFVLPDSAEAMLLIEFDGSEQVVRSEADRLAVFLDKSGKTMALKRAETAEAIDQLWAARRAISPSAFQLKPHKMSEDVVVPCSRIADLVAYIDQLNREQDVVVFTFGHAGDGNIHVNIMHDKDKTGEVEQARKTKEKLFEKVLELGGTISGEHGVGITKAPYLSMEIDAVSMELMRSLKAFFDPLNILNPGKIFP